MDKGKCERAKEKINECKINNRHSYVINVLLDFYVSILTCVINLFLLHIYMYILYIYIYIYIYIDFKRYFFQTDLVRK